MEQSLASLLTGSSSLSILLPSSPNLDEVAAGLGLFLALKETKETTISCPTPPLVEFNRLVGVQKITNDIGNKNLTIKFLNYDASGIERVSYDIENGEFKLTVIPKSGIPAPKKEQVDFSYSGITTEAILLIGGDLENDFPQLSFPSVASSKLAHIGVRQINFSLPIISFARVASSVSEIAASLVEGQGIPLDADNATDFLMGIEEGSKNFSDSQVNATTFEMVARLLKAGGRRTPTNLPRKEFFPPGSIPEKYPEVEKKPFGTSGEVPQDWFGPPKLYKGTSLE